MTNAFTGRTLWQKLSLAGVVTVALTSATTAFAGECPADKLGKDVTKPSTAAAKDVTDKVLSSIDLSKEKGNIKAQFRIRRLEVQPGGIVPWHSHGERPALIYIVSGEMTEHASNCSVPIVHKAGEVAKETSATAHWWQNTGTVPAVLLSSDILHDPKDKNM